MNAAVATTGPLDRTERLTVLALAGGALVTTVIGIGTKSFWFDEGYSAELARQPGGDWWRLLWEQEGGALLHAVLLKPWAAVSDADAWLRLLSVPFAIGQVVLTFFVGRRVIGRAAWAAALALAVNGAFVQYAQEARTYAMASFLVLAATLAFLRAVERPTGSRLVVYTLLAAACPLAHLYTAPFVVAQGLTLLALGDRAQPWRRWIVAGSAIGLAWMTLLGTVLVAGSAGAQPRDPVADRITSLAFVPRQFGSPYRVLGWVLLLLIAVWAGRSVSVVLARRRSERSLVAALPVAMVAVPLVVALIVPQIDLDTTRYLLPILPFLLIMAVGSVVWLSEASPASAGPVLVAGIVLVVAVSASGLVRWHRDTTKMDARTWTATLAAGVEPGDRVVFDDAYGRIVTEHYVHQGDLDLGDARPIRPPARFGDYFWDPERDTAGDCILDEGVLRSELAEPGRLWIVLAVPDDCVPTERVIEAIDSMERTVVQQADLDGPSALVLVE